MNKILFRKLLFIDICHIQRNEFINICFCPSSSAAPSLRSLWLQKQSKCSLCKLENGARSGGPDLICISFA